MNVVSEQVNEDAGLLEEMMRGGINNVDYDDDDDDDNKSGNNGDDEIIMLEDEEEVGEGMLVLPPYAS